LIKREQQVTNKTPSKLENLGTTNLKFMSGAKKNTMIHPNLTGMI
jgi:hypothetical protein